MMYVLDSRMVSKMVTLTILLMVLVLLHLGSCNTRDHRHVPTKLNYLKTALPSISKEISNSNINNVLEKSTIKMVAENFVRDAAVCINSLNAGVANNIQSNEHGKGLQEFLQAAQQYSEGLITKLQKDNPKLQSNLKDSVVSFDMFIPATAKVIGKMKESSKNSELATNSLMFSVDFIFAYFIKSQIQLESRNAVDSELRSKTKQTLTEAFSFLDRCVSNSYSRTELIAYSKQLKTFVHQLADTIKRLLEGTQKQPEIRRTIETVIKNLNGLENEISNKVHPQVSFLSMQNWFKEWLNKISNNMDDLENNLKDKIVEVRTAIFEALGIAAAFKIEFKILAEKP